MRLLGLSLMFCFSLSTLAHADPTPLASEEAVVALGNAALKGVVERGPVSLLEVVAPHWNIAPERLDSYKSDTRLKRKEKEQMYGKTLGYDLLLKKRLGDSLIGLVYVEKAERMPILWYLSFYKSQDKWFFYSYYWNSNFEGLLFTQDK